MVAECCASMKVSLRKDIGKVSGFQRKRILAKGPSWPPSLSKTQNPTHMEGEVHFLSSIFLVTPWAAFEID